MKGYLYIIKNNINEKIYIGSTEHYIRRKSQHFSELRLNKHHNKYLQNAYNKDSEAFLMEILLEKDFKNAYEMREIEAIYIDMYNTTDCEIGYNLTNDTNGLRKRKKVCSVDDEGSIIKIYDSLSEASNELNYKKSTHLKKVIDGFDKNKRINGIRWNFYREDIEKFSVAYEYIPCIINKKGEIIKTFKKQKEMIDFIGCPKPKLYEMISINKKSDRKYFYNGYAPIMILSCDLNKKIKTGVKIFCIYDTIDKIEYEFERNKDASEFLNISYESLRYKLSIKRNQYKHYEFYYKTY